MWSSFASSLVPTLPCPMQLGQKSPLEQVMCRPDIFSGTRHCSSFPV